jgi:hypothetical protein
LSSLFTGVGDYGSIILLLGFVDGCVSPTYVEFDIVSVVQSLNYSQEGTQFIDSTKAEGVGIR